MDLSICARPCRHQKMRAKYKTIQSVTRRLKYLLFPRKEKHTSATLRKQTIFRNWWRKRTHFWNQITCPQTKSLCVNRVKEEASPGQTFKLNAEKVEPLFRKLIHARSLHSSVHIQGIFLSLTPFEVGDGQVDSVLGILALGRVACTRKLFPLDYPKLLPVVESVDNQ